MRGSPIKPVDVLRALLGVWEKTCVHPYKMSLQKFIRADVPALRWMAPVLSCVLLEEGLVLPQGGGPSMSYQWNRKAGPPSMVMAKRILTLAQARKSEYARNTYHKKKQGRS